MKSPSPAEVVILSATRTPFGAFGGALKDLSATDLGAEAAKAALSASGVPPESVGHAVIGNVTQTSPDAIYLARHVALRAGLPVASPATTRPAPRPASSSRGCGPGRCRPRRRGTWAPP